MLTRRQVCECILNDFVAKHKRPPIEDDISSDSTLAVAMEELDLLTSDEAKAYATTRGGIMYHWTIDKPSFDQELLTFREFLDLLPEMRFKS